MGQRVSLARIALVTVVLVSILYVSTCSVISTRRAGGFEAVNVGNTKVQVLRALGTPSILEKADGVRFSRYCVFRRL